LSEARDGPRSNKVPKKGKRRNGKKEFPGYMREKKKSYFRSIPQLLNRKEEVLTVD